MWSGVGASASAAGPPATEALATAPRVGVAGMRSRVDEDDALGRPPLPADLTEAYGPYPAQAGDLRLPGGGGTHPVAVLLHGGCWRDIADRRYMEPLACVLTAAGWATWNVDYRTLDHEGGGFPGTFRDVAAAVDHLRELAARHALDPGRVAVVGHSAGGHLALWAAARHRIPASAEVGSLEPLPVRAAVGLAPIADLEAFDALERRGCGDAARRLMASPASPAGAASPALSASAAPRVRMVSPARLLPLGVPQLLVVGENDPVVPPEHVQAYARAARNAGDPAEVVTVEGAAHFEVVAPWWTGWTRVEERILRFLDPR